MVRKRALIWGTLAAILLLTGAGTGWLALNQDKLARTLIERLEAHLLTDAQIDHIDLDIWSHFPNVTLVLHDTWLLGSHSANDTLLKAEELSIACNALHLISGNYDLKALDLSQASLSIASNSNGWNTSVWDAGDEDTKNGDFAIDQLALAGVQLVVDGQSAFVDEAALQLKWTETGLVASGGGRFASVHADDFTTTHPLTWSGKIDWNTTADTAQISVSSLKWAGVEASLQATRNDMWTVQGAVESLTLDALRELVALPADFEALDSEATADGAFAWDGHAFKSNWTLSSAPWDVPSGDQILTVQGDARLWVKCEGGTWRADAPHVALNTEGMEWTGKVERILFDTGSFEATGSGTVRWPDAGYKPLSGTNWPTSGRFNWDGMIQRKRNGTVDWDGLWSLTDGAGTLNETPWMAAGHGSLDGADLVVEAFDGTWGEIAVEGNVRGQLPLVETLRSNWTGSFVLPELTFSLADTGSIALADMQLPVGMKAQCDLSIGTIQYDGWQLASATLALEGDNDGWSMPHFHAETLDGSLSGDGTLSFYSGAQGAKILLHPTASSCDLPRLFQAFDNFEQTTLRAEHLTGSFDASGSVQLNIDNAFNWSPENFDVLGSAAIHSGEITDLEAFQEIADYLRNNRLMAPLVNPDDLSQRLKHVEFEHVESPVYISNGTVQLPHTEIRSSAMDITLEGQYRFDASIDYTLGFAMRDLRATSENEFGTITDDGLGHQFFVSMKGTLEDPEYGWDRDAQKNHRKKNFHREKELLKELFRKSNP
ncbi:MAG: hypothetical protein CL828_02165 [Crocinitomicaceae bacterium]|nr:hypothetical protein [Crocinitomicaceae bacterium]